MVVNARFPARTRERLEHALDTLQGDGVIAAWHYRDWDEAIAQQRGWVERWREATLLIAPPPPVVAYYQAALHAPTPAPVAAPPEPRELPTSPVALGALIKARRREIGLSQAAAAALGLSQSYISRLCQI